MSRNLVLAVDMYGCPNRCKHCWLGHIPNKTPEADMDRRLVEYFKPYFENITFYSWLREPDYAPDYRARWERDKELSIGILPQRFELASFYRLARDRWYARFLKEAGVKAVQLTFFGMERETNYFVGRDGAFDELMDATEVLLECGIIPRWQVFINERNKEELVELLAFARLMGLPERCGEAGGAFRFFVHEGSADGENRKLYDIRICKENIPEELIPYYMEYDAIFTEAQLCEKYRESGAHFTPHNDTDVTLNISSEGDVYFNFTHMTPEWRIGNIHTDSKEILMDRILNEQVFALEVARDRTLGELTQVYGDRKSGRVFRDGDFKMYLLNRAAEEAYRRA
ncbi:MAG: radical SAM protein [Roseburia sp.]|nr:radical SAM protein [Roseburia sp.]